MDSLILQSIKQRWEEGQQKVALLLSSALNSLDVNVEDGWLLGKAAKSGYAEVVRMLLNNPQTEPSLSGNYAVRISAEKGHYQIVKMLLANPKVDPSADGNIALRRAAELGHDDVVELLLTHPKVNPAVYDHNALYRAILNGHNRVVQKLIAHPRGFPYDIDRIWNYITTVATNGNTSILQLLLSSFGHKLSSEKLSSILSSIAQYGIKVTQMLTSVIPKAKLRKCKIDHAVGLRYAAMNGKLDIVKQLLSQHTPNSDTIACMFNEAVRRGHIPIVKWILKNKTPLATDQILFALAAASLNRHTEMVELLMTHPAADVSEAVCRMHQQPDAKQRIKALLRYDKAVTLDKVISMAEKRGDPKMVQRLKAIKEAW